MENSQEFMHEWEKTNNPFYPNEMRWDRVVINRMLSDYEAQKQVKNNLVLADVSNRREMLIAFMEILTTEDLTQIEIAEFDNVANKFLGN
jgi:hypothetical protein